MTVSTIAFPRTDQGNDPADHPDDEAYAEDFKERVKGANEGRNWRKAMAGFRVTDEQVREIEAIRPIWLKLIFHQQYHVWVAPPNGGKTTIANRAAADMTAAGFTVWYINLDAGAAQLKEYQALANEGGFNLIAEPPRIL